MRATWSAQLARAALRGRGGGCCSSKPPEPVATTDTGLPLGVPPSSQAQATTEDGAANITDASDVQMDVVEEAGALTGDPTDFLHADTEQMRAEAAKPLPEGSEWHLCGGAELEEHFAYTAPIDAAWLLKLALGEVMPELNGVVPAWQQVPPEAKVNLDDLRHTTMTTFLPVLVLSYGWRAKHHPDPKGEMLRELIPLLRTLVESCTKGTSSSSPEYRPRVWGAAAVQRGESISYTDLVRLSAH